MILRSHRRRRGSILLSALIGLTVIGLALGNYLWLVANQNSATMRSMAWNACVPVMEAGVEEALTQLNRDGISGLASTGWARQGDGLYHKSRNMGDDGSYFDVGIQDTKPPVIFSTGLVRVPMASSTAAFVNRRVRVDTQTKGYFNYAMFARENIVFSGSARTDSFDSSNPDYSTAGKYDPAKARDGGDVASNGTVSTTFSGSATVSLYGHLETGPGGGYSLSGDASIGDTAWHQAGKTGVESGWFRDDMNMETPDVEVPFTAGYSTPAAGTVDGASYAYVLGTGDYKLSQFILSISQKVIVTGDAVLYITDTMSMSGSAQIIIQPGARLQIYNAAKSGSISGGGVLNQTGNAAAFSYWGLPSNTRLDMSGTTGFIGVIYAPEADLNLSGGSSTSLVDFTGACVCKTVNMSGSRSFHYDESLARLIRGKFVVSAWNEI